MPRPLLPHWSCPSANGVLAFAAHVPRVGPEPPTLLQVGTLVEPSVGMHPKLRHRTDMSRPKVVQQQKRIRLRLRELVQAVRDEDLSGAKGVGLAGTTFFSTVAMGLWVLRSAGITGQHASSGSRLSGSWEAVGQLSRAPQRTVSSSRASVLVCHSS